MEAWSAIPNTLAGIALAFGMVTLVVASIARTQAALVVGLLCCVAAATMYFGGLLGVGVVGALIIGGPILGSRVCG